MGFRVLMGASFISHLVGLLLAHMYLTVKDTFVASYRKDFLPTPQILYSLSYLQENIRQQGDLVVKNK